MPHRLVRHLQVGVVSSPIGRPVLGFGSHSGKLLDETCSRRRCPVGMTALVAIRSTVSW